MNKPTDPAKSSGVRCGVERESLGTCLHTALRKHCDSKATTALYNAIALDAMTAVWRTYLDAYWSHLPETGTVTTELAVSAGKAAAADIEYGARDRNILKVLFSMFDNDDWVGFTYYLWKSEG